jgi:hypothetical protein
MIIIIQPWCGFTVSGRGLTVIRCELPCRWRARDRGRCWGSPTCLDLQSQGVDLQSEGMDLQSEGVNCHVGGGRAIGVVAGALQHVWIYSHRVWIYSQRV